LVKILFIALAPFLVFMLTCGRAPSNLLRQGQSPVFDFPLYLSEGANGRVLKFKSDISFTVLISGLNNPLGIATDKFNNLYVVEAGNNRVLKVNIETGASTVFRDNLDNPVVVAIDSFGEVYVIQHGSARNVIRLSDDKVMVSYSSPELPTALAFGVDDFMIVGVDDTGSNNDTVRWIKSGNEGVVDTPTNISTDATGRVYVSENTIGNARIWRFHQRGGSAPTLVAEGISAPSGIAVDPVGNIYAIEQGNARVILIDISGQMWEWVSGIIDPQYLTFTQY